MLIASSCAGVQQPEAVAEAELAQGLAGLVGAVGDETLTDAVGYIASSSRNDYVVTCMQDAGFEYQVEPINQAQRRRSRPGDEAGKLSDEEYAREFGFGIAEALLGTFSPPPLTSVNSEHLDSLTAGEKQAWLGSFGSCDEGSVEVVDEVSAQVDPLFDAQAEVNERLIADPIVVSAEEEWSACLSEKGFPGWLDPGALARGAAVEAASIDRSSSAEVEAFREWEISVAVASNECRVSFDSVVNAVRLQLEEQLVEARPELRAAGERLG